MNLVSIIIPVHKKTSFLKECVLSALNQTHSNIEVIVVCNGKLRVNECKSFLDIQHSELFFFNSEPGRHHARNKGLEVSKGEFIQFLDYDDILIESKVEKQIDAINKSNLDKVVSITKWNIIYKENIDKRSIDLDFLFVNQIISGLELYQLLGKNKGYIMTASWLIPKKLILPSIKWEDVPNDDALFASEIFKENPRIILISEELASYRNHEENTRFLKSKKELKKLIYSWRKIRKNLDFNHYLVQRYFYNAYFYMLKYAVNLRAYKLFPLLVSFNILGIKSKTPINQIIINHKILFKKLFKLIIKKII